MLLNLTSDDFEQGHIQDIWNGANSYEGDGTAISFHNSRIRMKEQVRYNGDGSSLSFIVNTTNDPSSLYIKISIYNEDGSWYNNQSVKQMTKSDTNVFEYTFSSSLLTSTVRFFRVTLTTTNALSPKESDYITPDIINTFQASSQEYWKIGKYGPEPTMVNITRESMVEPYPLALWRCTPSDYQDKTYYNDDMPYHMLLNTNRYVIKLGDYWMNGSYPFIYGLELIPVFEDPKPLGLFSIDDGYPYYEGRKLINVLEEPEPLGIFRINNSYPFFRGMNPVNIGAFSNATNLKRATIPESVKYIGRYAFTNTKLKEVNLANDCEYYSTSFPYNCVVTGGIIKE